MQPLSVDRVRTDVVRWPVMERVAGDPLAHVSPGVRMCVGGPERPEGRRERGPGR